MKKLYTQGISGPRRVFRMIKRSKPSRVALPMVAVGVASMGVYMLQASMAASPVISLEPELVTPVLPAVAQNDATASGGRATVFRAPTQPPAGVNLDSPNKKEIAMRLVSSAENSSLNWRAQYAYIEDIGDGRGYTGGIIGFTSGTSDMLALVRQYAATAPGNILAKYIPALQQVNGTASHAGLDPNYTRDWKTAATDPVFQKAQDDERDRAYFNPAVAQAKADGLKALGQFIYYDAMVQHGPGSQRPSFGYIRSQALLGAKSPAQGGDEFTYLAKFLDVRSNLLINGSQWGWSDNTRVETAQRVFLNARNFDLNLPLTWKVYGDSFTITTL